MARRREELARARRGSRGHRGRKPSRCGPRRDEESRTPMEAWPRIGLRTCSFEEPDIIFSVDLIGYVSGRGGARDQPAPPRRGRGKDHIFFLIDLKEARTPSIRRRPQGGRRGPQEPAGAGALSFVTDHSKAKVIAKADLHGDEHVPETPPTGSRSISSTPRPRPAQALTRRRARRFYSGAPALIPSPLRPDPRGLSSRRRALIPPFPPSLHLSVCLCRKLSRFPLC